ncbi:MAG: hypothetical protein JJU31_12210 [Wenzhouxiangella sp.]|nr:hypothetical protein [Wenzhouxiangella sp.]
MFDFRPLPALVLAMVISGPLAAGDSCQIPDLSGIEPVDMMLAAVVPAGKGGDIPGGRWELVRLGYSTSPLTIPLTGQATGALELEADDPFSGTAGLALAVSITSPVNESIDEAASGPYLASGNQLSFENDCGEATVLGDVVYDIDESGSAPIMTLWGSTSFESTVTIAVLLQAEFELVDPQGLSDPIYKDRFEGP